MVSLEIGYVVITGTRITQPLLEIYFVSRVGKNQFKFSMPYIVFFLPPSMLLRKIKLNHLSNIWWAPLNPRQHDSHGNLVPFWQKPDSLQSTDKLGRRKHQSRGKGTISSWHWHGIIQINLSTVAQRKRSDMLYSSWRKNVMINISWKKTLFTRPSNLNKVHNSAVKCISWIIPKGLSLEHTKLFLTQVSEKLLVQLWGPGLKSWSQGWFMLSDYGFSDMTFCYLNLNHQKTPKFLSGRDQFADGGVSVD